MTIDSNRMILTPAIIQSRTLCAMIDENGFEIPMTETMTQQACDTFDNKSGGTNAQLIARIKHKA